MQPAFDLTALPTRSLLGLLKAARALGGRVDPTSPEPYDGRGPHVTVADIKAVLATRPHVPNKREARALRQARAGGKKARRAKRVARRDRPCPTL